jgi:hypothetical protein
MKSFTIAALAAAFLLTTQSIAGAQVSFGIRIGPPPPAFVIHAVPVQPAPAYTWINGYWYPVGNHYRWHNGYWARPPYPGAYWVAPRYQSDLYFGGYWGGHHHEGRGHGHGHSGHH